ncbi:hypothetical protein [Naasia sp. SYSU D00948]|uniref:hypothetical protein n=1 Tax=Naasia sp. SYSU D00948 TaxID=2817379 RepID=UPI001B311414|nr:hypothetical protein [Naasia sp. SYSU D00948]
MTDETDETATRRRTWIIAAVAAVAALGIAAAIILGFASRGAAPTPVRTTASASASASATPDSPTASPDPSASPTAAPAPVEPGEVVGEPGEEVTSDIDAPATVEPGLAVVVTEVNPVEGTANAPGEIAGPALQFVIEFRNSGDQPVALDQVSVTADYGPDRTPALELEQEETVQVPAQAGAGETVRGSYVFNVPPDERGLVRLIVFTSVDAPIVAFEGSAPR